ncbi:YncE family protein [Amycolatopsis sp. DSM 110486]|uniref:YncE family protein n=1 Tax=Amycolatopsis sp. DSM 110486 TaxID=2865832 RepID=UPI001C6A4E9B|nr:YncE family protein [Amycolatopsis sp. DSM 110486]QYN24793.1 YncE family protein [Amycolatopsis sp. DSM 110486]
MRGPELSRRGLFALATVGVAGVCLPGTAFAEQVSVVDVGGALTAVAVNPLTGLVYVTDSNSGSVAVIDPAAGRVTTIITVGGKPSDVAVDSAANRVYVANPPGGTVIALDALSHQTMSVVGAGAGASSLAVDSAANKVYAVSDTLGTLAILDTLSLTTQRIVAAPKPSLAGIALDTGRRIAYCTSPTTDSVEVYDIDAGKFTSSAGVGASPTGVVVHEASGTVFVANSAIHHMSIVDAVTREQSKTVLLRSEASAIAVHQGTDTIYTNGGQNGLSRVDGKAGVLTGELSLGVNPGDVAVDQRSRAVYVTDPLHGTVSVIRNF